MKLVIALLLSLNIAYASPLTEYVGCYETIEIDGDSVPMGNDWERSLTRIEYGESSVFSHLNGKPLNHLLLVLFTGAQGPWTTYHSFVTFPELGSTHANTDQTIYYVDEDVMFESNYRNNKVDHKVMLEINEAGDVLRGHVRYESRARMIESYREFVLEKTFCP
jgi:hypothetical protein